MCLSEASQGGVAEDPANSILIAGGHACREVADSSGKCDADWRDFHHNTTHCSEACMEEVEV